MGFIYVFRHIVAGIGISLVMFAQTLVCILQLALQSGNITFIYSHD